MLSRDLLSRGLLLMGIKLMYNSRIGEGGYYLFETQIPVTRSQEPNSAKQSALFANSNWLDINGFFVCLFPISQVGHSADGHCISGRPGDLAVLDPVPVQLHAGEHEADPGHGQGKPGDVFQVATRQACSVLSNRLCGPALAHDPWPYRVRDVAGDRRT